jgi:hypothetical protein
MMSSLQFHDLVWWLLSSALLSPNAAFKYILDKSGVKRLPLLDKSPNLNAISERWIRSVKSEALSQLILFGELALWHVLREYVAHYHKERPHQGKGNVILLTTDRPRTVNDGTI